MAVLPSYVQRYLAARAAAAARANPRVYNYSYTRTSDSAGAFNGLLTAAPQSVLQWSSESGEPEQLVVSVMANRYSALTPGTASRPLMRVRWGHGLVNRELDADLKSCRFPLVASNISIGVYDEGTTGPNMRVDAIVGPGDCESQLTWTSEARVYDPEPAAYVAVPPTARKVRCLAGGGTVGVPPMHRGVAAPHGTYLWITTSGQTDPEGWPIELLLNEWRDISATGEPRVWNHYCQDATATTLSFRAQFGLL